ncbi:MAG: thiolase family protein, partial [Nitrospinota bacterium]
TNSLVLTGGVEHLGHVPMTAALNYHPDLFKNSEFQWTNMGLTAEKLAQEYGISRREQDEYTLESNRRHFQARENGFFEKEIIPIITRKKKLIHDEEPRMSSVDKLASLKTPFKEGGTVTAASSSGISDGACMAVICDEENLKNFNRKPLAKILTMVNIGLDPTVMGLGPVYAIRKLLNRSGLTLDDIGLFEINEAFAVQMLACQRELDIDNERLNIHGGAVALGHPLGMSGLRLVITLAHSMVDRNVRYGIASLCVGHGQGVAMLLERN